MSKGHLEALAALKAMRADRVTKSPTPAPSNFVTVTKAQLAKKYPDDVKVGRPRVYASGAARQKAYRARKKAKA